MSKSLQALAYVKWEDLHEGSESELSVGPLTRTDFVRFEGASGDFNPNHHDEIFAIRSGFDSVFSMGPLQGSYLARLLTQWFGPTSLRTFQIRFMGQAWPGERLVCRAKVVRRYEDEKSSERRVEVEAEVRNQAGGLVIKGHATAAPQG